jgi:hypothetical protein
MSRADLFLAAYRETGSVTAASIVSGYPRQTHYSRLKTNQAYAKAFAAAEVHAEEQRKEQTLSRVVRLENALFTRAVEGWEEPIVHQGQFYYPPIRDEKTGQWTGISKKPLSIRKYSDSNAQFLLRGLAPERYRDRQSVEITGSVNLIERLNAGRKRAAAAPAE